VSDLKTPQRVRVLPARGALIASTDLHGNGEDFLALRDRFLALRAREPEAHWVLLGDLVHGPDAQAGIDRPELYLFEDQSWQIVDGVRALQRQHPGQVHLVLGNHDHGHVGGPRLAKFYADEVAQLESRLSAAQVAQLRELFSQALLLALAPCGLFLSHGSPEETHFDLARLDRAALDPRQNSPEDNAMLRSLLTSYGQPQETCARLLDLVSAQSGLDLGVVVHGHDRDEEGWFMEGDNQLCPVLFGAPRQEKRYLEIDLGGRYRSAADLRDGVELKRLHPG